MDKIRAIEKSLECFRWGLASLVPGLGIICAPIAINRWLQARQAAAKNWNPAGTYLIWGFLFACLGLLISLIAFAAIIIIAVSEMVD